MNDLTPALGHAAKAKAPVANGDATFFESIATPLIRDRGWKVVPCLPKDKTVHGKLVPKPLEQMSSNLDQIRAWAKKEPAANVAVYAQQIEGGLLFLDMDGARDIREAYRSETGNDFRTLFVRSSVQNGVEKGHWYFLQTPKTRALAKNISEDTTGGWFSLRVKNQYVCSIGSIHPITGKPYEAVEDSPVVPMPDELLDWLKSQARRKPAPRTTEGPTEHGKLTKGTRYTALISEVGRLWERGWGAALTIDAGIKWARENFDLDEEAFDESLVKKEIEHFIDSYPQGDGPNGDLILSPSDPLPSAREFVSRLYTAGDMATLRHQEGVFFSWQTETGIYAEHSTSQLKADLYKFLEPAEYWTEPAGTKKDPIPPKLVSFKPTRNKVENVLDALRAETNLSAAFTSPCWLDQAPGFDPTEMLACRNGLLHIPTRELFTASPSFFALNGVDFDFDLNAKAPEKWLRFLNQLWDKDTESLETLQELFGYFLTPRTHLQKIGLLVGPKRGGKGTIGRILRRVSGERNTCAPTLDAMSKQFGLAVLINKTLAVISDARIGGRTDTAVIAERLLSISGEDYQSVPRKFLPDWNGKLTTRFLLMTNELPWIEDTSGALASRFVILTLRRSFYGCEDHALFDNLLPELPGILNWAMDGWDHLYKRGHFLQPTASLAAVKQLENLSSPVKAFLDDEYETELGAEVSCSSVYDAWRNWCVRNGRERPGTAQVFARNVHSVMPWIDSDRVQELGSRIWYWKGLRVRK